MSGSVYRQELSPVHFLERAGESYADYVAVVDGPVSYTWGEFRSRSRRLASALRQANLNPGDRVAFLAVNSEALLLAHHAVPLAGGVIVPINIRLSADEVQYIVEKSGSRMLFYSPGMEERLARLDSDLWRLDTGSGFEDFLSTGTDDALESWRTDEEWLVSINYTSGTTGPPKGVMCTHRAAYLNALAMALDQRLDVDSRYLWTLPMFHCNGWMFPWALAAVGARSLCLDRIDPEQIWKHFDEGVTHFCAAPTVLTMLVHDASAHSLARPVRLFTAGSPPTPTLLGQIEEMGFEVEHVYGLTETSGPCTISIVPPDYQERPAVERAKLKARQGFPNVCGGDVRVVDEKLRDVPADGRTMGEVVMRGNLVMKGYFEDPAATDEAFEGGWFHSGDLAVRYPDGSFEITDRKKDIIISGGENVSSIEVEQAVASHPSVMECAVVRSPDEEWGEVVMAFVTLKPGSEVSAEEIVEHCRQVGLGRYKVPRKVQFGPLPKTPTGKIRKHILRDQEWKRHERGV